MQCCFINRRNHKRCVNKGIIKHEGMFVCGIHVKYSKCNEDCCICLNSLTPTSNVKVLKCKHMIHNTCYNTLTSRLILKCPLCRKYLQGAKINETITIHVNDTCKTYNLKDIIMHSSFIKHVMKRNRKYRPNCIMTTLTYKLRQSETTPFTNESYPEIFIHINVSGYDSFFIQFKYFPVLLKHMTFDKSTSEIVDVIVSLLNQLEYKIS